MIEYVKAEQVVVATEHLFVAIEQMVANEDLPEY